MRAHHQLINTDLKCHTNNQGSEAGSAIQATGTVELGDGLWIENQLNAQNGLQRVLNYNWGSTRCSVHTKIPLGAD